MKRNKRRDYYKTKDKEVKKIKHEFPNSFQELPIISIDNDDQSNKFDNTSGVDKPMIKGNNTRTRDPLADVRDQIERNTGRSKIRMITEPGYLGEGNNVIVALPDQYPLPEEIEWDNEDDLNQLIQALEGYTFEEEYDETHQEAILLYMIKTANQVFTRPNEHGEKLQGLLQTAQLYDGDSDIYERYLSIINRMNISEDYNTEMYLFQIDPDYYRVYYDLSDDIGSKGFNPKYNVIVKYTDILEEVLDLMNDAKKIIFEEVGVYEYLNNNEKVVIDYDEDVVSEQVNILEEQIKEDKTKLTEKEFEKKYRIISMMDNLPIYEKTKERSKVKSDIEFVKESAQKNGRVTSEIDIGDLETQSEIENIRSQYRELMEKEDNTGIEEIDINELFAVDDEETEEKENEKAKAL